MGRTIKINRPYILTTLLIVAPNEKASPKIKPVTSIVTSGDGHPVRVPHQCRFRSRISHCSVGSTATDCNVIDRCESEKKSTPTIIRSSRQQLNQPMWHSGRQGPHYFSGFDFTPEGALF